MLRWLAIMFVNILTVITATVHYKLIAQYSSSRSTSCLHRSTAQECGTSRKGSKKENSGPQIYIQATLPSVAADMEQVQRLVLLLLLLTFFTPSTAPKSAPCDGFCVTPVPTNATIGQETSVEFYCRANASSLGWWTIPGREEVGGNATTHQREDGIFVSYFTIPVNARNNNTNIACCIYRLGSGTVCSNTTLLIYTPESPTQTGDGASVNTTEGNTSIVIIVVRSVLPPLVLTLTAVIIVLCWIKRRQRCDNIDIPTDPSGSSGEETSVTVRETTIEMEGKPEVEESPVQEQSAGAGGSLILRSDLKLHQRKISTQRGVDCTGQEPSEELTLQNTTRPIFFIGSIHGEDDEIISIDPPAAESIADDAEVLSQSIPMEPASDDESSQSPTSSFKYVYGEALSVPKRNNSELVYAMPHHVRSSPDLVIP